MKLRIIFFLVEDNTGLNVKNIYLTHVGKSRTFIDSVVSFFILIFGFCIRNGSIAFSYSSSARIHKIKTGQSGQNVKMNTDENR